MQQQPHPYAQALLQQFSQHDNPQIAEPMAKYMRNLFAFYGIKSPERIALTRQFLRENGTPALPHLEPVIVTLWQAPQREAQYAALDILERMVKHLTPAHLPLLEQLVTEKSWWDTVDYLATRIVGRLLLRFPTEIARITGNWMNSGNMWLQRTAILFQLGYGQKTDTGLLLTYINQCTPSKEFFIQKAIGWALREYSKTNPQWVQQVVAQMPLAPLSKREALKWLQRKG
ncbi:DNA alkylation repair protein [Sphingobacteriales bacterium UPWRP_1]|nr:hypothetical protein BVG80_11695 [Sphingobacteriales bacterium TSM_CSM]PSJ72773.1 DNA alkylation repair protein [Sphingobacteriales bacterium UPWRP_1]